MKKRLSIPEKIVVIKDMEDGELKFRHNLLSAVLELVESENAEDGIREYRIQLENIKREIKIRNMTLTRLVEWRKALKAEIDKFIIEDGNTRSDFIREAIKDYIYFRKLRKLRDKMLLKARKNNVFTDDDVFNLVS